MRIAFRAETENWTFAMDRDGYCQSVVATPARDGSPAVRTLTREAQKAVGAQFIGAVDPQEKGGVAAEPRIGTPMLLGYVDSQSRIRVLRTGPLRAFEAFDEGCEEQLDKQVDELLSVLESTIESEEGGEDERDSRTAMHGSPLMLAP
jgi:hypothetical protein